MAARPGKRQITERYNRRYYLGGPGKPPVISVHWTKDRAGAIVDYGFAYIDFALHAADNGRALGYDNGHGFHERHFMGQSSPVDFISYEDTAQRFFAEVSALRKGE